MSTASDVHGPAVRSPCQVFGGVPAVVMGGVDLVAALGLCGLQPTVVCPPGDPARFSRWARTWRPAADHWAEAPELVRQLGQAAEQLPGRPVLYYGSDGDLLLVSRHREALARSFRFLLPDAETVEDLVDKARFALTAARLGLPVPETTVLRSDGRAEGTAPHELAYPVIVKPVSRRGLAALGVAAKAVRAETAAELESVWQRVRGGGTDLVAQSLVEGPETSVESHHCYVDAAGELVADFTGAKLRTYPRDFGHSCLLTTTDAEGAAADVRAAGRAVVARLGLRGVAKLDFKRDADGRLWLLEVNPRFTLWAHLAVLAGLDLPGLVHADLTGAPRPEVVAARAGVVWCDPLLALHGVRDGETSLRQWVRDSVRSRARSGVDGLDPRPLVRAAAVRRLEARRGSGSS